MIHRDVKPHNIIITTNGDIKLCDFGLTSAHGAAVSENKKIIGTPFYVSPEMVEMDSYQDNRSDIYSLGCTLFHLITGQPPFNYGSLLQVVQARLSEEPPEAIEFNPSISPGLSQVIQTMMARDPDHRYATASEVAEDLLRVRRGMEPKLVNPDRERLNQ